MLVEIIVAVSIITVAILAAMDVTQKSIMVARQSLHATQASFLLEEGAEVVRIYRDDAWTNISSLDNAMNYYPLFGASTWTLSATPSVVGIFTRKVNIASVSRDNTTSDIVTSGGTDDPGTKLFTVTVSWVEGSTTISKTLPFYIMNIF